MVDITWAFADKLELEGEALLRKAESLRQMAESLYQTSKYMSTVGEQGDERYRIELQIDALHEESRALASKGCDLLERSLEIKADEEVYNYEQ